MFQSAEAMRCNVDRMRADEREVSEFHPSDIVKGRGTIGQRATLRRCEKRRGAAASLGGGAERVQKYGPTLHEFKHARVPPGDQCVYVFESPAGVRTRCSYDRKGDSAFCRACSLVLERARTEEA